MSFELIKYGNNVACKGLINPGDEAISLKIVLIFQ